VMAKGFQRWLEALIDAGHSVAIRWVANPFLDSFREVLERFPEVWVMDQNFPKHLETFVEALEDGDEERAVLTLRRYYEKIDAAVREGFSAIATLASQGLPKVEGEVDATSPAAVAAKQVDAEKVALPDNVTDLSAHLSGSRSTK